MALLYQKTKPQTKKPLNWCLLSLTLMWYNILRHCYTACERRWDSPWWIQYLKLSSDQLWSVSFFD